MKKRLLLSLFLFLTVPFMAVTGQEGQKKIEGLRRDLVNTGEDTTRVKILIELSKEYRNITSDTGIYYGNLALKLAEELKWKLGIARSYSALGQNYASRTDNPTALDHYIKALLLFEELKDSTKISIINVLIGNAYEALGKYNDALKYALNALNYHKSHNQKENLADVAGNVGVIYDQMKDYPNATKYYDEAIKLNNELGRKSGIAQNIGNKAGIYFNKKDYKTAIELAEQSLAIYRELGDDKVSIALSYCNLGSFHIGMVKYYDTAHLQLANRSTILAQGISYLKKADTLSGKIAYLEGMKEAYDGLRDAYNLLGDYKTALDYFFKYSAVKDTISSTENKIEVANLEAKREIEKQKQNLEILELRDKNNQKTRVLYIGGIILLLIATIVVARYFISELRSNRQLARERKKHIERIRAQKTVLKDIAYIQSHEVRGPVSTIIGLTQLFNFEDPADPTNKELIEGIATVAARLDKIVTEVVNKENKFSNASEKEDEKDEDA